MKAWVPAAAILLALAPLAVVHPFRVQGRSMEPTLKDGEVRLALRAWAAGAPRRGEVWLLDGPEGPAVKRVAGLPGEQVEIRDGDLLVDGRRIPPPESARLERQEGSWACGAGCFLLGDNRPASRDCRTWGPLPIRVLRARVLGI